MRRLVALLLVSSLVFSQLLPTIALAQGEGRVRITANSLNVRSGPGTDFEVLAAVKKDEIVVLLRESPGWKQIQLENGTIGWVSDRYVEVVEATPAPPPPTRDPETPVTPPPAPPAPRSSASGGGGGSALGGVFKWGCLLGAVAMGGLAYSEKSKGDDAYDEYKDLFRQNMPEAAEKKYREAEDHDDTARTYAMVSGGLFVLWFAQQFLFGGGSSNYQATGPMSESPFKFDPANQHVQARVVLARF